MSVVKHFIEDSIKKAEIDEFLRNEFERAGYGGVSITKTPLGTHLVIYTMRPGLVIGRGGETIRALATVLEEKFELPSPQISVAEIEIPELNAYVVASRIASALKRGVHYRRAGFWGLTQAMEAGALGIEIVISGKLRTDRARYEKFREGYLPKSGEPPRKYMRKAELHVQLKPGTLGVKVRLIPPESVFPDQVQVYAVEEEPEREPEKVIVEEKPVAEEKVAEPEVSPVKEAVKKPESAVPPAENKAVTEEKEVSAEKKAVVKKQDAKAPAPAAEKKVVTADAKPAEKPEAEKKVEKKVAVKQASAEEKVVPKKETAKPEVTPAKDKKVPEKKVAKTVAPSVEEKVVPKKKSVKAKVPAVKKKPVAKQKVTKKVAEPTVTPVKKEKVPKKKVAKTAAPPAEEKKEAGE
jgi:small subunit ribosomal protein S3